MGREKQKRLRALINENLFRRIRDYWSNKQTGIRFEDGKLRILWQAFGERTDFINWLEDRYVRFDTTPPVEQGMSLFDLLVPKPEDG